MGQEQLDAFGTSTDPTDDPNYLDQTGAPEETPEDAIARDQAAATQPPPAQEPPPQAPPPDQQTAPPYPPPQPGQPPLPPTQPPLPPTQPPPPQAPLPPTQPPLWPQQPPGQQPPGQQPPGQQPPAPLPQGPYNDQIYNDLTPLYQQNPERAKVIHESIRDYQALLGKAGNEGALHQMLDAYPQLAQAQKDFTTQTQRLAKANAHQEAGNMDKALEIMGFKTDAVQEYYKQKSLAEEQGTLNDFMDKYKATDSRVELEHERAALAQQQMQLQNMQEGLAGTQLLRELQQNPLNQMVGNLMGNPDYAMNTIDRIYNSQPLNNRDLNKAYDEAMAECQALVNRFGNQQNVHTPPAQQQTHIGPPPQAQQWPNQQYQHIGPPPQAQQWPNQQWPNQQPQQWPNQQWPNQQPPQDWQRPPSLNPPSSHVGGYQTPLPNPHREPTHALDLLQP